jgi:AcrR family transcriptional regulator
VNAEKIIAKVGITKVTFYRRFPAKDDLIVAYLERRAQWERDAVEAAGLAAAGEVGEVFRMDAHRRWFKGAIEEML